MENGHSVASGRFGLDLVLDEADQGSVRVDHIGDGEPALLFLGRMEARPSPTLLGQTSTFTGLIKGGHIVQAKAAAETALGGVQIGIREKL